MYGVSFYRASQYNIIRNSTFSNNQIAGLGFESWSGELPSTTFSLTTSSTTQCI